MLPMLQYSLRSRIIHFCIISAIIIISSAKFNGWILNQRHKTRYFKANNPFATSLLYHPPLPHPHPGRHWPFIASRRNFREHPITRAPINFAKIKQASYHPNDNRPESSIKKPNSSICKKTGYFSYPNDCKRFYRCVATNRIVSEVFNGSAHFNIFHFACPAGTIFDERVQVCNHPRVAKCNENSDEADNIETGISSGIDHGSENNGFGSVIQDGSQHASESSPISSDGTHEVPSSTDSENSHIENQTDSIMGSGSHLESNEEHLNRPSEDSDSIVILESDISHSTIASTGAAIISESQESLQSIVESEDTSATVIMDGFVIEKPDNEEKIDSSHIFGESNVTDAIPNHPSAQTTTPISSVAGSGQQTQTEISLPVAGIEEQDAVFTSPSNTLNIPSSTGTSMISDNMDDNMLEETGSTGSIIDQISVEAGTQNPFIEPPDNTISNQEITEDVDIGNSQIGINTQGTPAFATTTESTIPPTATSNQPGSQNDNLIQDNLSDIDNQTTPSITEMAGNNSDSSSQVAGGLDNDLVAENVPSIDGVNVIPGVIQTISSQIEVSDEDSNDSSSMNSDEPESVPINIIDGFDVGSSSTEEDSIGGGNSPDQGDLLNSSNNSAIDIVITGDGSINDDNNFIVNDQDNKYTVLSGSLYECREPGYFPYELNCVEFYVCLEVLPNVLNAEQLYRCPKRYLFDDKTNRCQKEEKVACNKPNNNTNVSIKSKPNVLVVLEEFVDTFFNTSLIYNIQQV